MDISKYPTQVNQAMVRSNALLTVLITATALVTGLWSIMALLAADFVVRGFFNPRLSPLSMVSSVLVGVLPFAHKSIYFPPKQFAARVGLVFSATATVLLYSALPVPAALVMGTLIVFASLECFLNICMGCIVYNGFLSMRRRLSGL
ncbi:MAG: DUF4395 domain-containing protein [Alkalispirochaeta sp.]